MSGTDPGSKSAAEIEREVDRSRSEVEQTLDAIQDRLSPGQLIDQAVTYLRDGGGGEFTRNLGDSIKQNPMPLALVALGVGWMMFSSQRSSHNGGRWQSTDWDDDADNVGERYIGSTYGHGLAEDPTYLGSASDAGSGGGLGDRLAETSQAARDKLGAVGDKAGELGDRARDLGSRAREGIEHARSGMADRAHEARERARYHGRRAQQNLLRTLNEQPLVLGAIGLAVGAALGAALPPTETEDRLMGETRDAALRRAKEVGGEQVQKARVAAEAVVDAAREEAGEQGLTPGGEAEFASTTGSERHLDEQEAKSGFGRPSDVPPSV
jgi:ElaB/YqjD/DUF883 family membrane-anchored ribosome-binding protein